MKASKYGMTKVELDNFIKNASNEETKDFQIKDNQYDIELYKKNFHYSMATALVALLISISMIYYCYGLSFLIPGLISVVTGFISWANYNSLKASLMMKDWIKHFYKEMGI